MKKQYFFSLLIILFIFTTSIFSNTSKILLINNSNKIEAISNVPLSENIRIKILKNNILLKNHKIQIKLITAPKSSKYIIKNNYLFTDSNGIAELQLDKFDKTGDYTFLFLAEDSKIEPIAFKVHVKSSSWIIYLIFGLIGGLGLFLYGMEFMGEGLQKWAGKKMQSILASLTNNVFLAILLGLLVTAVIQSSSATTVMLVGFTNVGLMTLKQAIGVIWGATIGTTVTAQLVAFKLSKYALLFVGIGFFVYFFPKKKTLKHFGQVLFGFGLLFLGLKIMSDTMYPLRSHPYFIHLLSTTKDPYIAILISTIFTSIIQSSSATTGLVVALSAQGLITLEAGIPLIFGANIGTCITAGLASIGASREAKRIAIAHYTFKILGVLLFLPFIKEFAAFIRWFSSYTTGIGLQEVTNKIEYWPRQIANAHTFFSVIKVILYLPFAKYFEKMIYFLYPKSKSKIEIFKPKFIDESFINDPELSLKQCQKEIHRMCEITLNMINISENILIKKNKEKLDKLIQEDEKVDILYKAIKPYLGLINKDNFDYSNYSFMTELAYVAEELEKIGDLVSKGLTDTIRKVIDKNINFHEEDLNHIIAFHQKVIENFTKVINAFKNNDYNKANEILDDRKQLEILYKALQISHLQKFKSNYETVISYSSEYLSILSDYRDIYNKSNNIAYSIVEYYLDISKK